MINGIVRGVKSLLVFLPLALLACGGQEPADEIEAAAATNKSFNGTLADGAEWIAEVPAEWNGTLLLYSHGYNPKLMPPRSAPEEARDLLLERGFALAGSAYPSAEWAVAEAVPSQLLVLDAFAQRFGKPRQTIAWGSSMGGLVTSALAEQHADQLDGALTMCASSMGAVPMMNMALDGAFALTTLIPVDPPLQVTGQGDNFANVERQKLAVAAASETPAGRARIAFAGVLGGIPGWSRPEQSQPAATDYEAQSRDIAAMAQWGLFLPRGDQERRAGGVFSWNNDIDYGKLLESSGRSEMVRALYQAAGLDLQADLAQLNAAPRVVADRGAVDYMMKNYTSSGKVDVPVLSMHTIGDGMTSPSLQASYVNKVRQASAENMIAALWIERSGHCTQTSAEMLFALETLLRRIATGNWPDSLASPGTASDRESLGFIDYTAPRMPRDLAQSD